MTYIKLEDALKLVKLDERYEWTLEKLNSLPSIDFESIIDSVEDTVYVNGLLYVNAPELLNKLPK